MYVSPSVTRTAVFRCPVCKGKLESEASSMTCVHCGKSWMIVDDIPSFNTKEFYWNQIPKETMKKILSLAEHENWKIALKVFLLPAEKTLYDYATDPARADWHYLLPLNRSSKILDIGCGYGSVTVALAKWYRVFAVDATLETLRFLRRRLLQESVGDVTLAHVEPLDFGLLPFADNYFEAVTVIGVLEWVGIARLGVSPNRCQQEFLRETRRVLKVGGLLCVGIENRLGLQYLLGQRDHSGLRFTSLLPRVIANWLCETVGNSNGYRTYTYTIKGYMNMLHTSGFDPCAVYLCANSYRFPRFIVSMKDKRGTRILFSRFLFPQFARRLPRFMRPFLRVMQELACILAAYAGYFFPDYLIVARRRK